MTIRQMLKQFCAAFGIKNPEFPMVPNEEAVHKAVRLIAEEFCEFLEAVYGKQPWIDEIKDILADCIGYDQPAVDLVEAADALGDTAYVVESAFQAFGINSEPVLDEIHRTNMNKRGGAKREDGKQLKPEGWQPPQIAQILHDQVASCSQPFEVTHTWGGSDI